jgi:hypothetical protein
MGGDGYQGTDPAEWIIPIVLIVKLDHVSSRVDALGVGDQQRISQHSH